MKKLKCLECGTALKLHQGITGADWNCEAGEGSGFDVEISLDCEKCGLIYPLGNVRELGDFSPAIDRRKPGTGGYIEIDFEEEVEGYSSLTLPAKRLFEATYKAHNAAQGGDYKADWIPAKVTEHKDHLKVTFINGKWQHYYPGGQWG